MSRSVDPWPRAVYAVGWLALASIALPLVAMLAAVPWPRILEILSHRDTLLAFGVSLSTGLVALAIDVLVGLPLALMLARPWRGVRWARALVLLPIALPPVVAGVALMQLWGRRHFLGSTLESWGLDISFTPIAVVLAQVFVSLPFFVVSVETALRARAGRTDDVAATLGAGPWRILARVTLPEISSALGRGLGLAFARILGEFGATLTFAGSFPGITRTLPLEIYLQREVDSDVAVTLGAVLLVLALVSAVASVWPVRRQPRAPEDQHTATPAPRRTRPPAALAVRATLAERAWQVDVDVAPGEVVAVCGPNGSGKTTLIDVVAGLLRVDSGEVRLTDRCVDGHGFVPSQERQVALVPQTPSLFTHLTALDNVAFGLRSRGVPPTPARQRAHSELAAVGCEHLASRRVDTLSGGQAARVAVARALAVDPEVLLLDEPTSHLDQHARQQLLDVLAVRLSTDPPTTLIVTHDRDLAALCSRRIELGTDQGVRHVRSV